jgi:class 3 adenylate cyclase
MEALPTGTVTLLFTDIEGSTRLLQRLPDRYGDLLEQHRRILRAAFASHGGRELGTEGDSFFVAFGRAREAVAAAIDGQEALATHAWPDGDGVRVRMGIHTGEPSVGPEGYVGLGVHRAARICAAGHGGQVLLSDATRQLIEDDMPADVELKDLGTHLLKDIDRPERMFQALPLGACTDFPPLRVVVPPRGRYRARSGASRRKTAPPLLTRLPVALLGAAAVLVAIAGVLAVRDAGDSSTPPAAAAFAGSREALAGFAPGKRRPDVAVQLPGRPTGVVAAAGQLFVTTVGAAALTVVDGRSRKIVQTLPLGLEPAAVTVAADRVYVLDSRGTVEGFRIGYDRPVVRISYRNAGRDPKPEAASLTAAGGVLWATDGLGLLRRIDPRSRRVRSIPVRGSFVGVASGDGAVWAVSARPARVVRVDIRTSRVTDVIPIVTRSSFDAPFPIAIATTPGSVWVLNGNTATVTRIDAHQRGIVDTVPIGMDRSPRDIAASGRTVWVANGDGSLSYLRAGDRTASSRWIGQSLGGVAAEGDTVWVTSTALDQRLPGGEG